MKQLLTLVAVLFSATTFAQNVGIGETTPTAMKLQVKAPDSAVALIQNATTSGINVKTGLFFKTGNNYSGSIATIGSGATFRMGLFTYGGANPSDLIERVSISDGGNVGIGKTIPLKKLDVNGDLRADTILPTAIRMAPNAGDGKVLTSDAVGNATWQSIGSKAGYKYCKQITTTIPGTFTVPTGVTEVMVEAWGGGSGGVTTTNLVSFVVQAFYFGGTSGGYASTIQTVVPGTNLTYSVGAGSVDNVYTSTIADGGNSIVSFPNGNIVALGGKGHIANTGSPGEAQSGTSTLPNFFTFYGNTGSYPTFRSESTSATDYWKIVSAGNGGRTVAMLESKLQIGSVYYFLNGIYQYFHAAPFYIENYPSSGGGSDDKNNGGGDGMILIWYN
jgi:hypothetical protein